MRTVTLTLVLDEHADPPATTIRVDDQASEPATHTVPPESWFDVLRRVDKATGGELTTSVAPDLWTALEQLRQRITDTDALQADRRAAETQLAPVVPADAAPEGAS